MARAPEDVTEEIAAPEILKKQEFIDRAVVRTGLKKRDVKPAVEAALALLGEALLEGEDINLQPLGRLRIVKTRDIGNGAHVLTLKLRTKKAAHQVVQTGLAPEDDEG